MSRKGGVDGKHLGQRRGAEEHKVYGAVAFIAQWLAVQGGEVRYETREETLGQQVVHRGGHDVAPLRQPVGEASGLQQP